MLDKTLEEEIEKNAEQSCDASEIKVGEIKAENILAAEDSEALPGITVPEVLKLAFPAIAQFVLQSQVFFADSVMLGHYSTDTLASILVSATLYWCLYSTLSAFSIGAIALVGRAVGARDSLLAAAAARGSILLALGLGAIVALLSTLGIEPFLALFTLGSPSVLADADAYLDIMLLVMPLHMVAILAASVLQASGNTKIPFFVAVFGNIVNIFINYCLIFGKLGAPTLGIRGAAIGSVVAIAINAVTLVGILLRGTKNLSLLGWGGELAALGRVLRISGAAFSEILFRSIGYLAYTAMIGSISNVAMDAHEAVIGIEVFSFETANGFGIATAAIVSQYLGADRPQSAAAGAKLTAWVAVGTLSIGSLVFVLIPDKLVGIFSQDPEILAIGVPCFYILALAQPFMAASIVLEQTLRSAGDTRSAFYISIVGWFAVRIVSTYFFTFVWGFGLAGVWLGSTADWIVRTALLLIVFGRGKWQKVVV